MNVIAALLAVITVFLAALAQQAQSQQTETDYITRAQFCHFVDGLHVEFFEWDRSPRLVWKDPRAGFYTRALHCDRILTSLGTG